MLYGTYVDIEQLKAAIKKLGLSDENYEDCDDYEEDAYSMIEDILGNEGLDLSYATIPYYDRIYVGRCPTSIGDTETGKEFKEGVEKDLKGLFGEGVKCSFESQAWYDG